MSDPELPRDPRAAADLLRELAPQPPQSPSDNGPWDFLDRLGDAEKEQVRPVLHGLLLDMKPVVRERAISSLMKFPESKDSAKRLIDVAKSSTKLFRGVDADGVDLGSKLQHALANEALPSGLGRDVVAALKTLVGGDLPSDAQPRWALQET